MMISISGTGNKNHDPNWTKSQDLSVCKINTVYKTQNMRALEKN